jgi:hypothetical protein
MRSWFPSSATGRQKSQSKGPEFFNKLAKFMLRKKSSNFGEIDGCDEIQRASTSSSSLEEICLQENLTKSPLLLSLIQHHQMKQVSSMLFCKYIEPVKSTSVVWQEIFFLCQLVVLWSAISFIVYI